MGLPVKKLAGVTSESELIAYVSSMISEITGVQLGEKQYSLVQGRLARRMRDLKITDPIDYARHLEANEGVETGILTSLLTTHHTYFFREFQHFEFLLKHTLPAVIASHREKGLDTIRIWSAACSRGQEVYSLAMFLKHHLPQIAPPNMKFKIIGSDICEESVGIAKNGVYTWDEVKSVPSVYLQGSWARGTGEIAQYVRAKEDIRKFCDFKVVNLMNFSKDFSSEQFDIILCRNVFIYFSQQQIKQITREMLKKLSPVGHLFIGVSESLNGLDLPVEWVGPSVYAPVARTTEASKVASLPNARPSTQPSESRTPGASSSSNASPTPGKVLPLEPVRQGAITPVKQPWMSTKLKVLCVDDSPTVLALFKRLLIPEKGFEIVGTAGDGNQAIEKIRQLKPDILTLDIHMPNMNGLQFLEKYGRGLNIPVVMVSSVSREDSEVAFKCLELGAADYIEKPSLENLERIEEELQFKLRSAFEAMNRGQAKSLDLDNSFKKQPLILQPAGKLRVVVASFGAREELAKLLSQFRVPQPPTLVLLEGAGELLHEWGHRQKDKVRGLRVEDRLAVKTLGANSITVVEFYAGMEALGRELTNLNVSILALGPLTGSMVKKLATCQPAHLILEDRGERNPPELVRRAQELIPATSFVYESDRYFAEGSSPQGKNGGVK
jgi:chemotaxis protein methyltransferase CheR